MSLIEISPSSFAAPRVRPGGMDRAVPYEPMLEDRKQAVDWVTKAGIKTWYDSGAYRIPHLVLDRLRSKEQSPLQGTPGPALPDAPGAYRVAVIGDMGEGTPAEERNAEQVARWKPTHVATVGDNVYPLGREKDWAARFDPQFAKLRMSTTWQPALGNHDYYAGNLTPYFDRFPQLAGRAYYTWTLGPAQFFVLDTEQRLDGASAQQAWLAAELAKSTAPYRVIQMHRPMVSSRAGSIGRNIHGSLGPLLAKHGVQLVLAGHEHGYERSKELNGTTFMVSGGGGAASYAYLGDLPSHTAVRGARHHHLELSFDAAQMVVRAVDDRGVAFDSTVIRPHAAVVAAAQTGAQALAAARALIAPRAAA
ncbi:MAG: hypothetical protein JWM86_1912 [Thermoleophilia bacterium]|nr:hypothetical protein [Thermoleophilia bacterium]